MKIILSLLLIIMIAKVRAKPVDDDNPDAAAHDANFDLMKTSQEGDEKKDKANDPADQGAGNTDGSVTPSDIPQPDPAADADTVDKKSDDNGDSKPNTDPTPTPKQDGTKTPSPKPTEPEKSDKIASDSEPSVAPTTKPATSPSPSPSPTSHPQSSIEPTVVQKASVPTPAKATTAGSTVPATSKAKSTAGSTHPTTPASTRPAPTQPPPTKAAKVEPDTRSKILHSDTYGQTVEKSDNNTMKMNGTTFRSAVRLLDEKFTEDLNYQKNPVFQNLKKSVMNAVASVYDGYHDFKQIAIIGFTETPVNDSDNDKRDAILSSSGGNPVIADFYLRFFTYGRHLKKITDAIKTGRMGTLPVSPKFVKAYTAEPKGRVCTPDCRVRCFSYCDDGCCAVNLIPRVMSSFLPAQRVDLQWSSAPIAPHSQPIEEIACHGPRCLRRRPGLQKALNAPAKKQKALLLPNPIVPLEQSGSSSVCVGIQCNRPLGLPSEKAMFNQQPQSIKQCKGDRRCEAMLVRRVSIMKSETPLNRYMSTITPSGGDATTQFMEEPSSVPVMDQNVAKTVVTSPCVDPNNPACLGPGNAEQGELNALTQKMDIAQGLQTNAPAQPNECPPLCAEKCLLSCPNTCCYLKPPESLSPVILDPSTD